MAEASIEQREDHHALREGPGPLEEATIFWRIRWARFAAGTRLALGQSRFQVISVIAASVLLWLGLFVLFHEGFRFIQMGLVHTGLRTQLIHAVFNVFFLALTVMLVFSSAIILYGSLYRGDEVVYLLSSPARSERIVLYKFEETVFFSGWGFALLGSPMLLAYGLVFGAPWYYYLLLPLFIFGFITVPAGLGAILCLLVIRILPTIRLHAIVATSVVLLGAGILLGWRIMAPHNRDLMSLTWFQDVIARLEFSEQRLLPSWWLSSGVLEAAHPAKVAEGLPSWLESLMFLAVLVSNGLLLQMILKALAAIHFRPSFSSLGGLGRTRPLTNMPLVDRIATRLLRPLPPVLAHFVLKDLRTFRRDPVQWSQILIFFGLLLLYFFNVRRLDYAGVMLKWVTIMSFMNLAVVGLLMSTFTTRFIFPMVSLEGRRFWILGTAPIDRDSILWGKFCFTCAACAPPSLLLVFFSDLALRIHVRAPLMVVIHLVLCLILCVGLGALAVGLGARLPNLRELSPSKIAAGFGGTLNLLLSSAFIAAIVLLNVIPCLFWFESDAFRGMEKQWWQGGVFGLGTPASVVLGVIASVLVGAATTYLPLRAGLRYFRKLEV